MPEDGEYERKEDNTNYKAISCEQIPVLFLDKLVAKKHFGKFGKITRFILTPKRLSCTVEYETEEQAERACMDGSNFNGIDFIVKYAENKVAHVQDTEQWVDPDVQAELDAMSPGHRGFGPIPSNLLKTGLNATSYSRVPAKAANSPIPVEKPTQVIVRSEMAMPPPVPKPVPVAVRSELEAILRRPAFTDEDKYRVLDARDKLIRLMTVRQTDIKKAVAAKGTCPDMCPEKERLMREFQRQVSTFEMTDGDEESPSTISHRKAIKEYSRSSADQELPLSHELRSESVLQMTMLYLMHRIMDLCDDPQTSLGDWFHFVWDRTRSIRKDITQQELCSLGAVQLVEQCARFHIHCAARLVAEDPSVFDKKINAENLTKCLQTLKYMYHDLRIKGVECPAEAEFRSYVILLNLGDSNFLWEVKQLPETMQKSKEIKRAIDFYNALQNNNYVKFFAMIKSVETTYLSACILLGYFNKLRVRAMEVIIKSHNRGRIDVSLPLSYLSRVLGFDDDQSAVSFLSYYGLQCDKFEDRVYLDRMTIPSLEYSMDRALKLVESKRLVSVGECVCGQSLPSASLFEDHQPHSSFDNNGLLRLESWTADDQLRGDEAAAKPLAPNAFKTTEDPVFKMPQGMPITPKQQQRMSQQQPQQKTIFGSLENEGPTTKSSSPGGFKFVGVSGKDETGSVANAGGFKFVSASSKDDSKTHTQGGSKYAVNIFGGNTASSNDTDNSIFKSIASSIFKPASKTTASSSSIFNIPKPASQENDPTFQQASFFNVNKPLIERGSIFGGSSNNEQQPVTTASSSIFGNAAKETANLFQQNQSKHLSSNDVLSKDNLFQNFHKKPEMSIFGTYVTPPSQPGTDIKLASNSSTTTMTFQEMEQRRLYLEKQHQQKQKELEEEKRKVIELEEKRLKEKQRLEAERQREAERKRLEDLKNMCHQKAETENESLLNSIIEQEIKKIAHEELQKLQNLVMASQMQCEMLIDEITLNLVMDVANEEYADMCYDQMLLNRYFNRWLKHLRKKREQRKLMESTPIWVTTDTRAQFAQALEHPCQFDNLEMIKRYRLGHPCDFKQLIQMGHHSMRGKQVKPICLFSLVGHHLLANRSFTPSGLLQQRRYFKFLISIPSDKEELPGFETYCNKWLLKNIQKAQLETGPFVHGLEQNMALCVRKLTGVNPKNEQGDEVKGEGDHSDGVVFFLSGEDYPSQARRRLYNLLHKSKNYKNISVAIIAYNCYTYEQEITDMLDLVSLEEEGLLYKYKIFGNAVNRKEFSMRKAFVDSINFITLESYRDNFDDLQALAMENILNFLDCTLGEEIWQRWIESSKNNPVFQKICQDPMYVEGLYHKALQNVIQLTQEDLTELPEFPEELKEFVPQLQHQHSYANIPLGLEFFPTNWKEFDTKNDLYNLLQSIFLPSGLSNLTSLSSSVTIEAIELRILNYATKCIQNNENAARAAHLAIQEMVKQLRDPLIQTLELGERVKQFNYLHILKPIVFAYINSSLEQFHMKLKDAVVIYVRNDLKAYQTQPWWLNLQPLDSVNMDYTQLSGDNKKENVDLTTLESDEKDISTHELSDIIAKAEETSRRVEENLIAIKQSSILNGTHLLQSKKNLNLKRTLDESLYKFELAKKIGQYDTSFIDDLTHDIDRQIEEVVNDSNLYYTMELSNKRKRSSLNSCNAGEEATSTDEVNDAIAKALELIKKVESKEDCKEKQRTTTRIQFM